MKIEWDESTDTLSINGEPAFTGPQLRLSWAASKLKEKVRLHGLNEQEEKKCSQLYLDHPELRKLLDGVFF